MIPKFHGEKLHDIPDDQLAELLPVAKKIAQASNTTDYNILQNNGAIAHQVVPHVSLTQYSQNAYLVILTRTFALGSRSYCKYPNISGSIYAAILIKLFIDSQAQ